MQGAADDAAARQNASRLAQTGRRPSCRIKLKFHGTDTDTDTNTDILADLSDTRAFPREDPREDVR